MSRSPEDFLPGGRCYGNEFQVVYSASDLQRIQQEMVDLDGWLGLVQDDPDRAAALLNRLMATAVSLHDDLERSKNYVKKCATIAKKIIQEDR